MALYVLGLMLIRRKTVSSSHLRIITAEEVFDYGAALSLRLDCLELKHLLCQQSRLISGLLSRFWLSPYYRRRNSIFAPSSGFLSRNPKFSAGKLCSCSKYWCGSVVVWVSVLADLYAFKTKPIMQLHQKITIILTLHTYNFSGENTGVKYSSMFDIFWPLFSLKKNWEFLQVVLKLPFFKH